jgi:hypothetical protein
MKLSSRMLARIAALAIGGLSLAGCVYYPDAGYGYGRPAGYYAAPVYVAPPPVVVVGGGWGGGWGGGRGWR